MPVSERKANTDKVQRIDFTNAAGKVLGSLYYGGDQIRFKGENLSASAKEFFAHLTKLGDKK